jgi:hypothetical protein
MNAKAEMEGTFYEARYNELVLKVESKANEIERIKREQEETKRKILEAMRSQSPVYFADFSKGKLDGTFKVTLKDCGFPYVIPLIEAQQRPTVIRFIRPDGSVYTELSFKTLKAPAAGLLTLTQWLPPSQQNTPNSEIEVFLNGKSIEKRLLTAPASGGNFTAEFGLNELKEGENTIKIVQTGGNHLYLLSGVELRLALAEEDLKALKDAVEKEKETIAKANVDFLTQYNEVPLRKWRAEIDRSGNKPPKKNEWEPLFDGTTLKFWRATDNFAEWKVENGAIVGINKSDKWSGLEPVIKKMYDWLEYDLKYEITHEGQGYAAVGFYAQYRFGSCGADTVMQLGANEPAVAQQVLNKSFSILVEVREEKILWYVNGKKMESEPEVPSWLRGGGYFIIRVGPNSTVRIKDIQIKLYKTK